MHFIYAARFISISIFAFLMICISVVLGMLIHMALLTHKLIIHFVLNI